MPNPSVATILARIRSILVEPTVAFWDDDELVGWYNEGGAEQHRLVIDTAKQRPDVNPVEHHYLRAYLTETAPASLTVGQSDYPQPADSCKVLGVTLKPTGEPEVECQETTFAGGADWRSKILPQFGGASMRPLWSITSGGKVRLYFDSADATPPVALPYVIRYLRDVAPIAVGDPAVDVADPYNVGPVRWAVGMAFQKQNTDASPWFQQFGGAVRAVLPPPPPQPQAR